MALRRTTKQEQLATNVCSLLFVITLVVALLPDLALGGRGEEYNVLEKGTPQKNYTEEEDGKVAPYR